MGHYDSPGREPVSFEGHGFMPEISVFPAIGIPSAAKAGLPLAAVNVRAEARTLQR